MTTPLKLVIFDVDGTLVDSQGDIVAAMGAAFAAVNHPAPDRTTTLGVVGLSLDVIMPRLMPELTTAEHAVMVEAYKSAYMDMRVQTGVAQSSPLYPHAVETLRQLQAMPDVLLGVATGKSKRGLDKLIEGHGLQDLFVTQQVADHHPSKPHPSMVLQAMADTGVGPQDAVMVGDTSFDMDMAHSAGVRSIGVSWGYHPVAALTQATHVIDAFPLLAPTLTALWGRPA